MEPYHIIYVTERGPFEKISKNKRRKLQRYNRIETSERDANYRLREILKAEIPFFLGAFGNTSHIWRKLERNALVIHKRGGGAKTTE